MITGVLVAFELPPEVITTGVITGLTYALLAVGLVLVYKTTRVLNFAHGEMGALPAVIVVVLVRTYGWNYWLATITGLAVAVGIGALMEIGLMRRLARAPRLLVLVATIGAAQVLSAVALLVPKDGGRNQTALGYPVPFDAHLNIGSLRIGTAEVLILVVVPLLALGLAAFLGYTNTGLASRAVADNADASRLSGVPVRRIALTVWIVAAVFAAMSVMLISPTRPVGAGGLGPSLMLRALTAAMVGSLVNIPVSFAAGVGLGVVEVLLLWNYPEATGLIDVVLLGVIVLVLLVGRLQRTRAGEGEGSSWSIAGTITRLEEWRAAAPEVRRLRRGLVAAALVFAVVVPHVLAIGDVVLLSGAALFAIMGLSLTVLTGYAGQVSLGQFSFVAVGAAAGGRMLQLGYPYWMAAVYAMAAGGLVALVIGMPALRVRGIFLAVTTLGVAVAIDAWLSRASWFVHVDAGGTTSLSIRRPTLFGIDFRNERAYYYLCLVVLLIVAVGVRQLGRSGAGRSMMAVRDNESQAAALGVPTRRVKLKAFVLSGVIAGLAGFLYGGLFVTFAGAGLFDPQLSLALLGQAMVGGITTVTGAIAGALYLRLGAKFLAPLLPSTLQGVAVIILGGAGLLGAVLLFPGGIAALLFRQRDRVLHRLLPSLLADEEDDRRSRPAFASTTPNEDAAPTPEPEQEQEVLRAESIVVRYGGNTVLGGVSLHARQGEIVGLLGPNGAGKTTLFDVLTGFLQPDEGRVLLHGVEATRLRPEARAQLSVGRTFQQARLFGDLPLRDALKVALERHDPSELVPSVLALPPSRRAERVKASRVDELLTLVGLERSADRPVAELSTGMRRLAELAALVGLGADVLLLDEPTAGIAQREVEAFSALLPALRDHLAATIVLIEHDIPLVMELSDRIYVLAAGQVLAEGPPAAIREDERVVAAYLGTDARVIQRSGALA